jgi:hypothetical protein
MGSLTENRWLRSRQTAQTDRLPHWLAVLLLIGALGCALPAAAKKPKDAILVNFSGALKRVTKKQIVIEPEPENEMTFIRTGRTTFRSGGRNLEGASLPAGIIVTVQGFEKLNREIEAVTVTVAVPDQSPNK